MDDLERVRLAARKITEAQQRRDAAIIDAVRHGVQQAVVAKAADLTRQRVGQIARGEKPAPERALLAPEAGPVTVAVVQKRDPESGQPTLADTTRKAVDELRMAAETLGSEISTEPVPPPGDIDLNRDNLAVLIGPRISALIGQALSADPFIRWTRDGRGRWYITDTQTGREYRSDFDEGWQSGPQGNRMCIAHIGRIRRPDGNGSFLYLGGAHSPGTAGAVRYFTQEMCAIWEKVYRSPLWSAVVRTEAAGDGTLVSWELASPIYTHERS